MEDIVESFAKRLGIEHKAARQGIVITCRHFFKFQNESKQQVFYQCYHQG